MGGVSLVSNFDELAQLLGDMPHKDRSLFLAMWSLSEVGLDLRRKIAGLVSDFECFMLAFQDAYAEVNNTDAFAEWQRAFPTVTWQSWPIQHSPGNSYLIGRAEPRQT